MHVKFLYSHAHVYVHIFIWGILHQNVDIVCIIYYFIYNISLYFHVLYNECLTILITDMRDFLSYKLKSTK